VIIAASVVLGVVFVVAGVTKVAAPAQWRSQSADLGVPTAVATVVPFVELALGALLIAQLARTFAAIVAGLLLVAFTLLLIVRLAQGRRPPCACFGALTSKPIGWRNVVRNLVFLALAAIVAAG
jgi:uncharacterized membrane protein YphA (DoxX/SURF4 family)